MSDAGRNPINFVFQPGPVVINISPLGFLNYAKDFYNTGASFKSASPFSPVPYYLFCHALELSLKAFLLAKGISKKELKDKHRHNLTKILNEAIRIGINEFVPVNDMICNEIRRANNYYNNKYFEYYEVTKAVMGYQDLPDMAIVEMFIRDVMDQIEPICSKA